MGEKHCSNEMKKTDLTWRRVKSIFLLTFIKSSWLMTWSGQTVIFCNSQWPSPLSGLLYKSYFIYFLSLVNKKMFAFPILHFDTFISIRNKLCLD